MLYGQSIFINWTKGSTTGKVERDYNHQLHRRLAKKFDSNKAPGRCRRFFPSTQQKSSFVCIFPFSLFALHISWKDSFLEYRVVLHGKLRVVIVVAENMVVRLSILWIFNLPKLTIFCKCVCIFNRVNWYQVLV